MAVSLTAGRWGPRRSRRQDRALEAAGDRNNKCFWTPHRAPARARPVGRQLAFIAAGRHDVEGVAQCPPEPIAEPAAAAQPTCSELCCRQPVRCREKKQGAP
jgi:hypothetical protein